MSIHEDFKDSSQIHVLRWLTNKDDETPKFLQVKDPGNVVVNPTASSSTLYPGGFNPWISSVTEDSLVLTSTERTRYMW